MNMRDGYMVGAIMWYPTDVNAKISVKGSVNRTPYRPPVFRRRIGVEECLVMQLPMFATSPLLGLLDKDVWETKIPSSFERRPIQSPGMMRHGPMPGLGRPPGHRLFEALPRPELLENKIAYQAAETKQLTEDNHRLAATLLI
ncbi:hypothetical protein Prudu_022555 [Prunus dulcis]|uniref:Uncharacterized protein n=1 Tax=Prunus dulcis TaxID=3755 RepID=A0A4Y1RZM3_PRUDU|nr:hypothetical protein Prudu_022555 [Prunus dulcis]